MIKAMQVRMLEAKVLLVLYNFLFAYKIFENNSEFNLIAERCRLLGKEIASSFIREESSQLESILNGSVSNRNTMKDYYKKKSLKADSDRDSIPNNKDPLI